MTKNTKPTRYEIRAKLPDGRYMPIGAVWERILPSGHRNLTGVIDTLPIAANWDGFISIIEPYKEEEHGEQKAKKKYGHVKDEEIPF